MIIEVLNSGISIDLNHYLIESIINYVFFFFDEPKQIFQ
jgi:hypothetical protein